MADTSTSKHLQKANLEISASKTGVLLMNTGTPEAPTEDAARDFLKEMLSDPALISMPPFLWNIILHRFILPKRPKKTAVLYKQFWTKEGSPFLLTSFKQRDLLQEKLGSEQFQVEIGMRYGKPSIASALKALYEKGCKSVVLLPLYPQYVKVCNGTCFTKADDELALLEKQYGWKPQVKKVEHFFENSAYIKGLAHSVQKVWKYKKGSKLVISFHSTPVSDIKKGDPYKQQTEQTAQMLADALNLADNDWVVSYQSRFDNRKWLSPFTLETVEFLGAVGTDNICIIAPGFVSDNLETIIELGQQMKELFLKEAKRFGVKNPQFSYVEALNDDDLLIQALAESVLSKVDIRC